MPVKSMRARPQITAISTERNTLSQLVWNRCDTSCQLSSLAQLARNQAKLSVTGRLPNAHGRCST
jgi:hypothetical protein